MCVWPCHAAQKCGGLDNTLNFFHRLMTNKQPNNYTATPRDISTCCLSHCGSSSDPYRPLHKFNIVTHMWYYPNMNIWCQSYFLQNQKEKLNQFCIKRFCAKSFLSNFYDRQWKLYVHFEFFSRNQKCNRMELLMNMIKSPALRLYWTCAISKGNPLKWPRHWQERQILLYIWKWKKKDLPLKESHRGTS